MKKRLLATILAIVLVCSGLTACGGKGQDNQGTSGKIQLSLWSTYTEASNVKMAELVAKFNAESEKYEVKMEIGQSGSGNRQKLAASTQEYYPSMFMGTNNTIIEYAESKYTAPIQQFIDNDSDDWTADMLGAVKTGFSDTEGNLIGVPVGNSVKGYMVNIDYLTEAGYALEDMTTFEKIAEAAQTAKQKDICQYGYIPSDGTNILNMLLYQGVNLFDGGDGYTGDVTKCLYGEGETNKYLKKYCEILAGLYKTEAAMKNSNGADGGITTFVNGKAMFWATTSSFVYEFADVEMDFEWAFIPFRGIDDDAKYTDVVFAEGTGIFIGNTGDEAEMQGAYEFIKFLARPENQIFWCTFRGYTPYTKEALESQDWITWRDANHPTAAALEAPLQNENMTLRFPNVTVMSKVLTVNQELTSYIMADPNGDIDEYIKQATDSIQQSVDMANARK
ncbi:MAG: extracellular solute-binding protein [Tyzzerella sp.]|nr:extracellular solute-binding protein [Tyzzerella sp.]